MKKYLMLAMVVSAFSACGNKDKPRPSNAVKFPPPVVMADNAAAQTKPAPVRGGADLEVEPGSAGDAVAQCPVGRAPVPLVQKGEDGRPA